MPTTVAEHRHKGASAPLGGTPGTVPSDEALPRDGPSRHTRSQTCTGNPFPSRSPGPSGAFTDTHRHGEELPTPGYSGYRGDQPGVLEADPGHHTPAPARHRAMVDAVHVPLPSAVRDRPVVRVSEQRLAVRLLAVALVVWLACIGCGAYLHTGEGPPPSLSPFSIHVTLSGFAQEGGWGWEREGGVDGG